MTRRFSPMSRGVVYLALAGLVLVLAFHVMRYWVPVDDAFIAFRYARNLSAGDGLVFNRGERVEGYTDFLWVVVLAGADRVGLDPPRAAGALGLVFTLALVPATYLGGRRGLRLPRAHALLSCLTLVSSAPLAMWAGGGLETSLYGLLITLAISLALRAPERRRSGIVVGVFFGLAYLTRPEAAGLVAIAAGYWILRAPDQRRNTLALVVAFAAIFVPHLLFRLSYYGYPLPNTFYAKTDLSEAMIRDGLEYTGEFMISHGIWAMPVLLGSLLTRRGRAKRTLVLTLLGAATVYVVLVGGDIYPYSRFLIPYFPWWSLLLIDGCSKLSRRFESGSTAVAVLAGALPLVVALSLCLSGKILPDRAHREAFESSLRASAPRMRAYGEWLGNNLPPDTLLAISSLGRIPYYSELPCVDMLGLADEHIAHREMELDRGFLGHQKYDSEYVLSRKPDIVAIEYGTQESDFDPARDLTTKKILERVQPEKGWWPAPSDLIARLEFQEAYSPRAAEVQPGLWFVYFERDTRLAELREAVSAAPDDPELRFLLGLRLRTHGFLDEAISEMRRSVERNPAAVTAWLNLGFFEIEAARFESALATFEQTERRFPEHPHVTYGKALALLRLGRRAEAVPLWLEFLERAPTGPFADRAREFSRLD